MQTQGTPKRTAAATLDHVPFKAIPKGGAPPLSFEATAPEAGAGRAVQTPSVEVPLLVTPILLPAAPPGVTVVPKAGGKAILHAPAAKGAQEGTRTAAAARQAEAEGTPLRGPVARDW